MLNDVTVKITLTKGVNRSGFEYPLILASKAAEEKVYTEYTDITALARDYSEDTEAYKVASKIWEQENAPSRVAIYSSKKTARRALDDVYGKGWRQLITLFGEPTEEETGGTDQEGSGEEEPEPTERMFYAPSSGTRAVETDDTIADVAEYMEAKDDRLYFARFKSAAELTSELGELKPKRTVAFVYGGESEYPQAALVGATAGRDAGSFTYKNMILKGVIPETVPEEKLDEIHAAGGLCFVTKSGDNVTTEGKAVGGEYIDVIDSMDYIIQQIVYKTQKLLNSTPKIPYTNQGIAMLELQCLDVLKDAYEQGIISTDEEGLPNYSTDYGLRNDVPVGDKTERKYLGGKFKFELAGAVHEAAVSGEIIV